MCIRDSKSFAFFVYFNILFSLYSLVKTVGVSSARHYTACKLINNHYLVIFNNVVLILSLIHIYTWFVGFAPYEDPQIAVTVMIPFGEASSSPAAVVGREIIGEYMGLNYEPENSYMDISLAQ